MGIESMTCRWYSDTLVSLRHKWPLASCGTQYNTIFLNHYLCTIKNNGIYSETARAKRDRIWRCSPAPTYKTKHDVTRLARFCLRGLTLMFNISVIFEDKRNIITDFFSSSCLFFMIWYYDKNIQHYSPQINNFIVSLNLLCYK